MKNTFKIIVLAIVAYIATSIIKILFIRNIHINLAIPTQIIIGYVLGHLFFIIFFSLLWSLFLRDKNIATSFLGQIKLKKVYFILVAIFTLLSVMSSAGTIYQYKKSCLLDDTSHFIDDSTYENSKYHFKLVYPKGSVFANAHPEHGFVTRFFLPNGESIGNDEENVGMYIKENSDDDDDDHD